MVEYELRALSSAPEFQEVHLHVQYMVWTGSIMRFMIVFEAHVQCPKSVIDLPQHVPWRYTCFEGMLPAYPPFWLIDLYWGDASHLGRFSRGTVVSNAIKFSSFITFSAVP